MVRLRSLTIVLLVLLPLSFWLGYRAHRPAAGPAAGPAASGARRVLYYVDPMNPSFRSAEPGIAPCGMPLEPVYADEGGEGAAKAGSISVRADRQQLIGVRLETVASRPGAHALRLLGRVAVDESRLFRLNSVTAGWVREVGAATTGSIVRKGEVLASFYAPEFGAPQQNVRQHRRDAREGEGDRLRTRTTTSRAGTSSRPTSGTCGSAGRPCRTWACRPSR